MSQRLSFLRARAPLSLAAVATAIGARIADGGDPTRMIHALAPLSRAEPDDATAFVEGQDVDDLLETRAGACLVAPGDVARVPPATVALVTDRPRAAMHDLAALLHPASMRPGSLLGATGIDPSARVASTACLEAGVVVEAGANVGSAVEIGANSFIGAACIIGDGVRIGRGCAIDAGVIIGHALLGDRVVVHAGACLGHVDSRPSIASPDPSLGRLIVQDDVEIGAKATIARGRLADTIIGEGARIASLTPIGADVVIERGARVGGRDRMP